MKISHISFARSAAIFGGIPLGVAMVVVQIVLSQSPEWNRFMLLMAGSAGALVACIYHRSKPLLASIRHDTVIGTTVGLSGALVYFTITAIIFAVVVSRSAVLVPVS